MHSALAAAALAHTDVVSALASTDIGVSEAVRALPAAPLRGLIAAYDGYRERGVTPALHRGLPSPFMTLIVTLHEPLNVIRHVDARHAAGNYDALVGGLHATPALIRHDGRQSGVQVRLSPLGARGLLGVPAGELAGLDVSAEAVLGALAGELHERLAAAPDWPARFAILDRLLGRRAAGVPDPPPALAAAWRLLLRSGGALPVSVIAREVGWGERHLSGRFRAEFGLAPKAAARIVRFHRARHALQREVAERGRADIAWTAARCGYADQSHLDRDFNAFAELPPSRWLLEEFRNVQAESLRGDLISPA
jgi:AraC-like DNA-binding protein